MPTLIWQVTKGHWNVHAIYIWLCDMGLIQMFNALNGEEQYEFLTLQFGED